MERLSLLSSILTPNPFYSLMLSVMNEGRKLFEKIKACQLDGIVAKRRDSAYVGRRSDNWLKIINYQYADVVIAGYRKDQFGWLAHYDDRPAGIIELAVPAAHKRAFYTIANAVRDLRR